jgi:hypothetical protein
MIVLLVIILVVVVFGFLNSAAAFRNSRVMLENQERVFLGMESQKIELERRFDKIDNRIF